MCADEFVILGRCNHAWLPCSKPKLCTSLSLVVLTAALIVIKSVLLTTLLTVTELTLISPASITAPVLKKLVIQILEFILARLLIRALGYC